ncbi:hypothetical protein BGX27_003451, partial [Mortierella sp. AM989]
AQRSPVPEIQMDGKEMERMWKGRGDSVDNYWHARTLKKLRSKNIIAAARNSSSLQISLGDKQLKDALHDLQSQHQRINQKAQESQVRDPHPISINNTSNQCQGQEPPSETTLLLQDQICSDISPSQVVANSSTALPSPTSLHAPGHKSEPMQNQNLRINDQPITTSDKPSIKRSHDAFPSEHSEEIGSLAKPSKRVCEVQQIEDDNTQLSNAPLPCASPSSKATPVPAPNGGEIRKRVSPIREPTTVVDDKGSSNTTPPTYSPSYFVDADLPSDPADLSFVDHESLDRSISRLYAYSFLDGPGRIDSNVDNHWVCNGVEVSGDLMAFRNRVIENNDGLIGPHEKLVVNFIFLIEAEHQTGGLQGEIEDHTWDSLGGATKDLVPSLASEEILEAHQWTHHLARSKPEEFAILLEESPLRNPALKTPVQGDTRGQDLSLLIPDYGTTTQVGRQQLFVVVLEGKIAGNVGSSQEWDDLTKVGQEMKLALDSILKLKPEDEVCVVELLVREPLVEFYSMTISSEATYIMQKFTTSYIVPGSMNAFPLLHLMEIFEYTKAKVEHTEPD